jgi:nucleoside-diphosphate-sugar epimerase
MMHNNKKILIIGCQGYLGSKLIEYLSQKGHVCEGIDLGFFQFGVIEYPKFFNVVSKNAEDIGEIDILGFDVVIQLAGISNDPFGDLSPEKIYNPTRKYALNIAKICKKLGCKYIFPSSCSVYGIGNELSHESSKVFPQTPYSANKVEIEEDLKSISDKDFNPIILRLATVFGMSPRMRFDLVINMLCGMALTEKQITLNSNGEAWRPHVHIDDVCEVFNLCLSLEKIEKYLILNVGSEQNNMKIIDVAKIIRNKVKGCSLKFHNMSNKNIEDLIIDRKIQDGVDTRNYQVSFGKLNETFPNFKAKFDISNGINHLLLELEKFKLTSTKFKQLDFYRLQQLDFLYKTKQLKNINLYDN